MFISSHDSGETSIKSLRWTCSSQKRDCPCKLSLTKEAWQCQRDMAIMGVPTMLLDWGQAGQGRPLVGTCLHPAGKGRKQGKIWQSNPVNPTEGQHRIPVGVME